MILADIDNKNYWRSCVKKNNESSDALSLLAVGGVLGFLVGIAVGMGLLAYLYPMFQSENWAAWVGAFASSAAAIGAFYAAKVALVISRSADEKHENGVLLDAKFHFMGLSIPLHKWMMAFIYENGAPLNESVWGGQMLFNKENLKKISDDMQSSVDLQRMYCLDPLISELFFTVYGCIYQVTNPYAPRDSAQVKRDHEALVATGMILKLLSNASKQCSEGNVEWLSKFKSEYARLQKK